MSIDTDTFKKLYKDLNEVLKVAFNSPKLYLVDFFDNLRAEVDIEYELSSQKKTKSENAPTNSKQLLEEYESIINKITSYERECLANCTTQSEERNRVAETINEIECALKSLQKNDVHKFSVIQKVFEETMLRFKRILFMNRSMIFLTRCDLKEIFELISGSNLRYSKLSLNKASFNFLLVIIKNTFMSHDFLDFNQGTFLNGKNGLDRVHFLEELSRMKEASGSIISLNLNFNKSQESKTLDLKEKLIISNGVQNLGPDLFKNMDQLITLSLRYNKLNSLDLHSFQGLSNLQSLDLSSNQIVRLEPNIFGSLKNVTSLDLSDNILTYVTIGSLAGLNNLEILDLSSNKIDTIDLLAFANLHNLLELNMANNRFHNLPEELFRYLTKLKVLNLSENRLNGEEINVGLFKGLACLEELSLSGNKLKFIETDVLKSLFKDLVNLKYLYLGRTELSCLPSSALKGLKSLVKLDFFSTNDQLKGNDTNIPSLRGLSNLKNHHLARNKISKIECGAIKDLKKLE